MGHYYDCIDCGYERCQCNKKPSMTDDRMFRTPYSAHAIEPGVFVLLKEHDHYKGLLQARLSVNGQDCPVDIIVTVLNRLIEADFGGGIATVNVAMYRKLLQPTAAGEVIVGVLERLGLAHGETRARTFGEIGAITFIGHRNGPWKEKAKQLSAQLTLISDQYDIRRQADKREELANARDALESKTNVS